ncbi:MAG: Na/Pi cotransporter family protein [Oscillospiraceae bacterium]|nr:Na/Pi cotransporter family protein [Oscillospiraceae bacterium]
MFTPDEMLQLIQSMIWLLAGVGIFIVGMNFMSGALEKSAGAGMKTLLGRICGNRFSGVCIGAGVTAIIQSSSATSVMVIGLVNAGVMTLMQAVPVIMGANIGTTITGILVALKNDFFNMAMYFLAFAGVMMGFVKKEKVQIAGSLCSGLGLIFVGLNIMSSPEAFGSALVKELFTGIFGVINFPLLLIVVGAIFTALIQSSSAATGVVITMVGTGILELDMALFIILGANIGTCVTALLASVGATANAKRVALIHFTFNVIGSAVFAMIIWMLKEPVVTMLTELFPGEDAMSLQMRVSAFHVVFNVTTTLLLLPFVSQLVLFAQKMILDKEDTAKIHHLRYVDDHLLAMPAAAMVQAKKEIDYMLCVAEENIHLSLNALCTGSDKDGETINENENIIDFTNGAMTAFLIKLSSAQISASDEATIGAYFHVLNDLERIGDHALNFYELSQEMKKKELTYSQTAQEEIAEMCDKIRRMFAIAKEAFQNLDQSLLPELTAFEEEVDDMKDQLTSNHYARLSSSSCSVTHSPYYTSTVMGLERVADHLVNVGYSIKNPTGSQKEHR